MKELSGIFSISARQNSDFAMLSGDYNPLHMDPVYSRRLQFGQPVIHGIHHMLRAWDAVIPQLPFSANTSVLKLTAVFPNPVMVDQEVHYQCLVSADPARVDLSAYCGARKVLAMTMDFVTAAETPAELAVPEEAPPVQPPVDQTYPPDHSEGTCRLYFSNSLADALFPNLSAYRPAHHLAQILACTRVVGMKCPGLHSIFSKIALDFRPDPPPGGNLELRYFEKYKDSRVHILKLGVESPGMVGTLDTFFRPPPVVQQSYAEVHAKIPREEFSGQRALVIGGSRGVGETTAKILAAGGAEVVITYSKGRKDAEGVAAEITGGGARCRVMELDVTALSGQSTAPFDAGLPPSHVYYFASPHIVANRTGLWNSELHAKFCRFYLDAFSETVSHYAQAAEDTHSPITIFYPSSIFVDQPEKGFSEYAVAKAGGEALCNQLSARYRHCTFFAPRLPRMSTDQTSSIIPVACEPVFDVMWRALEKMRRGDAV